MKLIIIIGIDCDLISKLSITRNESVGGAYLVHPAVQENRWVLKDNREEQLSVHPEEAQHSLIKDTDSRGPGYFRVNRVVHYYSNPGTSEGRRLKEFDI